MIQRFGAMKAAIQDPPRGGSHHLRLPAAWKQSHPFTIIPIEKWLYPFTRPEINDAVVTVAGELCTPNDILARDVGVPHLRAGDILLFSYVGAYGWAISHHDFLSHPHPDHYYLEAGIVSSAEPKMEDLKKNQTYEDQYV